MSAVHQELSGAGGKACSYHPPPDWAALSVVAATQGRDCCLVIGRRACLPSCWLQIAHSLGGRLAPGPFYKASWPVVQQKSSAAYLSRLPARSQGWLEPALQPVLQPVAPCRKNTGKVQGRCAAGSSWRAVAIMRADAKRCKPPHALSQVLMTASTPYQSPRRSPLCHRSGRPLIR
jgi:hypothetical protein